MFVLSPASSGGGDSLLSALSLEKKLVVMLYKEGSRSGLRLLWWVILLPFPIRPDVVGSIHHNI